MNINDHLLVLILSIVIISCSNEPKEIGIRKAGSDFNLFGYSNAIYKINDEVNIILEDTTGIYIELNENKLKTITINKNSEFELSNGIKMGSSKDEIIKLLGKPIKSQITLNKSSNQIGSINAMIYKDLIIILDENHNATSITFGEYN